MQPKLKQLFARTLSFVLIASIFSLGVPLPEQSQAAACADPSFTVTNLDDVIGSGGDVEVVDLDEDGDLDFLATSSSDVYWYSNDGSANFTRTLISDATASNINSIDTVDMDEDGDIDFIVGAESSGKIHLFLNDGSESFTESEIATFTDVKDVIAVDLNGAGGIDVAAVSYTGNSVKWWANDGSESFDAGTSIATHGGAIYIDTEDINDDGDNDLVATGAVLTSGGTEYYENNGSGSFTTTNLSTLNDGPVVAVDIDEDGDQDIIKMRGGLYVFTNDGSESFSSVYQSAGAFNGNANSLDNVDVDGDGDIDLITSDYSGGFGWLENDGSESFTVNVISDQGSLHNNVDAGDFNNDGYMDLIGVRVSNNAPTLMMMVCDTTPPSISSLSPTDNSTGVAIDSNLVMNFGENVNVETGNVTIKKTSDDTTVDVIDITSGGVTGDGTATITINPSDFEGETEYYVQVAATAIDDIAGNSYAGITDTTSWSFTTADIANPLMTTLSPVDDDTDVVLETYLIVNFNEAVDAESGGNINIYRTADDTLVEAISVTGGDVSGSGTSTITAIPTSNLAYSTSYYVQIEATAFDDPSSNSYAGITDTTSWSFTTLAEPQTDIGVGGFWHSAGTRGTGSGETNEITVVYVDFSDIETHENLEAIQYLMNLDVVQGYEDGEFKPEKNINRAEFTKILVEIRYPGEAKGVDCFPDVTEEWFAPYICYAKEKGIVSGYPDGTFLPGDEINLAEALKMIMSSYDFYVEAGADEEWYIPYYELANSIELLEKILAGVDIQISRGEMAQLIYNIEDYLEESN